jgi:predicted transcriptional regulator
LDEYLDEIVNLLFNLSSVDRLTLLLTIRKEENLRLTQLAEKIRATIQETSRHVGRLTEAKLIEKKSDGFYRLTSYGRLVLLLLSSFSLISKTRDYFLSHDISFLPQEFIERIGELSVYEYAQNVSNVLRHIEQVMSLANEYVWLMADQALVTGPSVAQAVGNRDLSVRIMISKSGHIPEQYQHIKTLLGNKLELKLLSDENAKIAIAMNEKIAGVSFPDLQRKMDFDSGFMSSSIDFHKWCNDVFNFYWNRSKKPFLTGA